MIEEIRYIIVSVYRLSKGRKSHASDHHHSTLLVTMAYVSCAYHLYDERKTRQL